MDLGSTRGAGDAHPLLSAYLIFHTEKKRKIGREVITLAREVNFMNKEWKFRNCLQGPADRETREGKISRVICF